MERRGQWGSLFGTMRTKKPKCLRLHVGVNCHPCWTRNTQLYCTYFCLVHVTFCGSNNNMFNMDQGKSKLGWKSMCWFRNILNLIPLPLSLSFFFFFKHRWFTTCLAVKNTWKSIRCMQNAVLMVDVGLLLINITIRELQWQQNQHPIHNDDLLSFQTSV